MLHDILYVIHLLGMSAVVAFAALLTLRSSMTADARKRAAVFLMSAAHTQLLSGFSLFVLMLNEVDHMKLGIKMLLAVEIAFFSTIYKRSLEHGNNPKALFPLFILISALTVTAVAFLL